MYIKKMPMIESINENLTVNVTCPFCERLLKNRGLKIGTATELVATFEIHCIYCNETFQVQFDSPSEPLT